MFFSFYNRKLAGVYEKQSMRHAGFRTLLTAAMSHRFQIA